MPACVRRSLDMACLTTCNVRVFVCPFCVLSRYVSVGLFWCQTRTGEIDRLSAGNPPISSPPLPSGTRGVHLYRIAVPYCRLGRDTAPLRPAESRGLKIEKSYSGF